MVRVSDPRDSSACREEHRHVRYQPETEYRWMVHAVELEVPDNLQEEPGDTGNGTARVNTSKMLKHRRAAETPPERCPLITEERQS